MTETEELRRMLDERGVEWKPKRGRKRDGTEWHDQFGVYAEAVQEYSWDGFEHPEGKLLVRRGMGYLTPEQAIAATLGDADLAAENAKLREELEQWHKLTAGIELPEYPITQFQPKDLERENAKLIEFASAMYRSILLVPDDHIPAETKTRYFETAVSFGLDVPDD